jgi:hypothetical protein
MAIPNMGEEFDDQLDQLDKLMCLKRWDWSP